MTTGITRRAIAAAAMVLGCLAINNARAAVTVPGVFEAESFNAGGEGIGYHDRTVGNQGDAKFRMSEGVDIFISNDPSGGVYVVKNFEAGEWLAYTIKVTAGGNYDFELRAATNAITSSAFHLEVDGTNATGTVVLPNTAGSSQFQWLGKRRLALTAGTHVLRVVCDRPYFVLNSIRATAAPVPSPYFGTAAPVPGSVEAAYFDNGGEGLGYHDTTTGNQGDAGFRANESVDIFYSNDTASGSAYILKNFTAGEWLSYTINVTSSGNYDFEVRAATDVNFPNSALHAEIDGVNATGTVVLPATGGWSTYQWIGKRRLALTAGTHVLKIVSEQPYFAFNSFRVTVPAVAPPPDPSKVLFSCGFLASPTECGFSEQSKVPGRATLTSIARDGTTGLRLHTEPGDNNVASSGEMERDDVFLSQAASDGYEGHEAWWAHSIYFPDDFTTPTWESYVVFDFHNSAPGAWQANFHVAFERQSDTTKPGLLSLFGYGGVNSGDGRFAAALGEIQKKVWYDFVYHVRWSSGSDGFFDAWLNGKRVLSHRGPTLYAGQGVYLKLANYHSPVCDPYPACIGTHKASSVIYDRIIRGTTPLAVSSGALEGVLGFVNGILTPLVP